MAIHPRTVVVVPTIRQNEMQCFLDAWEPEFASGAPIELVVVEDHPDRTFTLTSKANISHYCWRDIDDRFGDHAWIVPRRTVPRWAWRPCTACWVSPTSTAPVSVSATPVSPTWPPASP